MRGIRILLASLMILPFALQAADPLAAVHDDLAYRKAMSGVPDTSAIWIAHPQNLKWTKWKIVRLEGEEAGALVPSIKKARYESKAGDSYLLDISFEDQRKMGSGVVILEYPGGKRIGLLAKPARANQKALVIVNVSRFNPAENELTYEDDLKHGFDGIVLDREVKSIFVRSPERKK